MSSDIKEVVEGALAAYKAEWLSIEDVFNYFSEPLYFNELRSNRPTVLVGGRGSGKTTTLLALSYEGQRHFSNESPTLWPYFGLFQRININRTAAFSEEELGESKAHTLFAHYLALAMCENIARFIVWYEQQVKDFHAPKNVVQAVSMTLALEGGCENAKDLLNKIADSQRKIARYLDADIDSDMPPISVSGQAVDEFLGQLLNLEEFENKSFFYIFDEYENLTEGQQKIVNTLIKHSSPRYAIKVGVRENGFKTRATLADGEYLEHPADYVTLKIEDNFTENEFIHFGAGVWKARFDGTGIEADLAALLPGLSRNEEAELLLKNSPKLKSDFQESLELLGHQDRDLVSSLETIDRLVLWKWAHEKELDFGDVVRELRARPEKWKLRFGNYRGSVLFTIKEGTVGIRKYYSGLPVIARMAGKNIRAFLELVDTSLKSGIRDQPTLQSVSQDIQTKAAEMVGKKWAFQIEGKDLYGRTLATLVLSFGRLFGLLCRKMTGSAPEISRFEVVASDDELDSTFVGDVSVREILKRAVMQLALVEHPSTKHTKPGQIKGREYQLHPIFSAYFVCGYSKKRKIRISCDDFVEMLTETQSAIERLAKDAYPKGEGEKKSNDLFLF